MKLENLALIAGATFVIEAIVGNALYMNPLVARLYARHEGHQGVKHWKEIGSFGKFLSLNMLAGLVLSALYALAFALMRGSLPDAPILAGLSFSGIVIAIKAAPEAFNQHMNINYPRPLVLAQLCNSSISLVIAGLALGLLWEVWPVIA